MVDDMPCRIDDGTCNTHQDAHVPLLIDGLSSHAPIWRVLRGLALRQDMLEIGAQPGNYSWGGPGLTLAEARSHYTLWAILKSPLLLGADASR